MLYKIHNAARNRFNKITRAQQPTHRGLKQVVCGDLRIVRGRPATLTREMLEANLESLKAKEAAGLLYVTTDTGLRVNLNDLSVVEAPAAPPAPNFPLDSAANDTNTPGLLMNRVNDPPIPDDFTMPVEPPVAAIEQPLIKEAVTMEPPPAEEVPTVDHLADVDQEKGLDHFASDDSFEEPIMEEEPPTEPPLPEPPAKVEHKTEHKPKHHDKKHDKKK